MMELVSQKGKKIAEISDSSDEQDTIMVGGKKISLSDAYSSTEIKEKFNKQFKKEKKKDDKSTT